MRQTGIIIIILLLIGGCSNSPAAKQEPPAIPATQQSTSAPRYDPQTFRTDVTRLVAARQYRQAVALLKAADVSQQIRADHNGYIAIGEDMIVLPGVYPQVDYNRSRDWYVPGTSDAIEDSEWQSVATDFAYRYNTRRHGMGG